MNKIKQFIYEHMDSTDKKFVLAIAACVLFLILGVFFA